MRVTAHPGTAVLAAVVFLALLVSTVATDPTRRERAASAASALEAAAQRPDPAAPARSRSTRPPAPRGAGWSGYAFDACRAPSQPVMDRWLHTSPFLGVGIYLGGIHRACEQRHLTAGWVTRQTRAGWQLLPIWVGPQASCTGYRWRIDGRPGRAHRYGAARRAGSRQARLAVGAARRLGIDRGETLFYDIEPFSTDRLWCRQSSLTFLDAWTRELHRRGYRSGVYSHVRAGIALLNRAPARYAQPDAVWFAWVSRKAGVLPREHVRDQGWMRTSRVHQFALDTRVRFGGISMDIDWNHVSLGGGLPSSSAPCGAAADRLEHPPLTTGGRGPEVSVAQCLLASVGRHPEPAGDATFGPDTHRAVAGFQRSRGLAPTGAVDRSTWTALLAEGHKPVLKRGSRGEPVRRLQRSLNAALRRDIVVDGVFGTATASAVRRYQGKLGRPRTGHVVGPTWQALSNGRVVTSPEKRSDLSARADRRSKTPDKAAEPGKKARRADRAAAKERKGAGKPKSKLKSKRRSKRG